jgi:hypothetical protein
MLKSKIAMALAAAMVMAALYGCSSSSDSGLKSDASALQGTIDKVAMELGLLAGATEEAILAALGTADPGELAKVRAALPDIASDAGADAIAAAITALRDTTTKADLGEDGPYTHQQAVVAGINAADADRFMIPGDNTPMVANDGSVSVLTGDDAYEAAADDPAPEIADWTLNVLMDVAEDTPADGSTTVNKAIVYHNRKAPADAKYDAYYGEGGPTAGPGKTAVASAAVVDLDDDASDDVMDNRTRLTFNTDTDISADGALIKGMGFPTAAHQTFTFVEDTDTDAKESEITGTFQDVPGTYACASGACSVMTDEDSKISMMDGAWTFTADEGDHTVTGAVPDNGYVSFGYWLNLVTDDESKETFGVNTFTGGGPDADAITTSAMTDIVGTADYSGKAGGKYAAKTLTSRGEVATLHAGQFVANVALEASFGGNDVAINNQHAIKGSVTGFEGHADHQNLLDLWTVTLGKATTNISLDDANIGETNGGMMDGSWTHEFRGRGTNDPDTDADDINEANLPPGSVVGTFDAHFSDGHIIGAYGATKD